MCPSGGHGWGQAVLGTLPRHRGTPEWGRSAPYWEQAGHTLLTGGGLAGYTLQNIPTEKCQDPPTSPSRARPPLAGGPASKQGMARGRQWQGMGHGWHTSTTHCSLIPLQSTHSHGLVIRSGTTERLQAIDWGHVDRLQAIQWHTLGGYSWA